MRRQRTVVFLLLQTLLILEGGSFELQDTIHTLIEENIHLHDQLENLTQAFRELKRMLWLHSGDHQVNHDEDIQHLWDDWSEHGLSAETHLLLEHVFCGHELHSSAASLLHGDAVILLLMFSSIAVLLVTGCL